MGEVPPRKAPHYEPVDALVIRTAGDVSPAFLRARALLEPIVETVMAPRPVRPSLVGSAEGAIDRLLLTIPAYAVGSRPLADAYRHLLRQLPPMVGIASR